MSDPTIPESERLTHCDNCGLRCDSAFERIKHVKEFGATHNEFVISEKTTNQEGEVKLEIIARGVTQVMPGESESEYKI